MAAKIPITKKMLDLIQDMKSKGAINTEIIKAINVEESWFYRNMDSFSLPIKKGAEIFRDSTLVDIETQLFKSCFPQETTETHDLNDKDGNLINSKVVTKTVQPSQSAIYFTLVNKTEYKSINNAQIDIVAPDPEKFDKLLDALKYQRPNKDK